MIDSMNSISSGLYGVLFNFFPRQAKDSVDPLLFKTGIISS